jgi:hypothetical protein
MRLKLLLITLFLSAVSSGQSIWTNDINGKNPGLTSPYTSGQTVDGNMTVSGIGRGTGTTTGFAANDRYNTVGWTAATKINLNKYLEFTVTPKPGYEINFDSFVYTGQVSSQTSSYAFRSSLDNYTTNIGTPIAEGTIIPLTTAAYQKISKSITFRFYVYNTPNGSTSYSINDFTFNGTVVPNTMAAISTTTATLNIGESTELVASSVNTNYNYKWSPAKGLSATTGARVTARPTTSTVYTVTGTDPILSTSSSKTIAVNVNAAPICVGESGTLEVATICSVVNQPPRTAMSTTGGTSDSTSYGAVGNISINILPTFLPPDAVVTSINTTISCTANANNSSRLSALRVQVMPPAAVGSTLANIIPFSINTPGATSDGTLGTWTSTPGNPLNPAGNWLFQFRQTINNPGSPDVTINNIRIIVNYTLPGKIEWYTVATGGTPIGTEAVFNPVGVPGSGLANTNTAGTTTFYSACSGNPSVRTASNFVINPTPAINNMTATSCSQNGFIATPVNGTNGVVPAGTTYSWPLPVVTGGLTGGASATATTSITGTLTNTTNTPQTATYTITPTTGTCSGNVFTVTVTVNPNSVGGMVTGGTTISSGATSNLLTLTGNTGTVVGWESATSPFSTWSPIVNTASTYTSGTLTQTTQFRAVVQSGNCLIANSDTTTVTVSDLPIAPSITQTQPSCAVPTGTITITPVAGETYSFDGGGYSSTLVYSELAQGSSHTIYAQNASGAISLVTNATVAPLPTNIWTNSWSLGTPTVDQNIDFQGDYSSSGSITGCSCKVTSGNVVINSGDTMTITNGVTLPVTTVAGTSLTFENTASLVQINNVQNVGDIIYKRNTQPMLRYDFTDWSSPVASQNLYAFSPATLGDKYYSYDSVLDNWTLLASQLTNMELGRGYSIRAPQTYAITGTREVFNAVFTGVPNNGIIASHTGLINGDIGCLIGNPYPSAISADNFLSANNTVLEGTIYFWTHNTPPNPYEYSNNDYASYNGLGGTETAPAASGGPLPTGFIAAGQSFHATGKTGVINGTVIFNNDMRVATTAGATGNNVQFFRMGNKTKTAIEKSRIWLNMSNTKGEFRQTLLGYITGATNQIDKAFDGVSYSASAIDFYSICESENLVIQGRSLPFDTSDKVPLGYSSTINGNFSISIGQTDGLFTDQDIFLEDKVTGMTQNLKNGSYNFTTVIGTFNDRFVLKYSNGATFKTNLLSSNTGTFNNSASGFDAKSNAVIVSVKNKQIKIKANQETLDKVFVYDLLGKLIYQKANIGNNEFVIKNLFTSQTILIVKTILKNSEITTDKIIFE